MLSWVEFFKYFLIFQQCVKSKERDFYYQRIRNWTKSKDTMVRNDYKVDRAVLCI